MGTQGDALDLDELTGTDEAAPVLGVVPKSVRAMCQQGVLPSVLIGRVYVMRKADVDALARRRAIGSRP